MGQNLDLSAVEEILDQHGRNPQNAIAILQDIQEEYHYLPKEAFPIVAKALKIGEAKLYGIATFYENFSLDPKGKYVIRCCDGTACHVRGSQPILNKLREQLGLKDGRKTTDDLNFTLETVSCLGACGLAPAVTVNGKIYPKMDPDRAALLLEELKEELANENE